MNNIDIENGIVFQKMLMLLVMMSIGFLAGKTRVMSVESNHMLSLLINKITMPCLVVYSSVCNAHSMSNRELLILLGIYFVSFVLMIVVARLFRLLISPERGHAGIYELLLIFPNSAFIGIPVASALGGMDALLATVQMPPGFPVATVAMDKAGARNAAWLAAQILAVADPALDEKIRAARAKMQAGVEEAAAEIEAKYGC